MVGEMSAPRTTLPHAHYMGLSGTALRVAIGATAGLSFISFGYGQGDIGALLVMPSFQKYFPRIAGVDLQIARMDGITVGIWNLGGFVGAMSMIWVGNVLGRKGSITAGLCIMIAGQVIQSSTFSYGQYLAGRFVAGFGNGWIASTVPAWQAECLKTHQRGTLLMVSLGSCVTAGLALAYWLSYALSWTQPSTASWRAPIAAGTIPMFMALLLIIAMPESPRYLILTGREEEAKKVLSALNEVAPDDEDVHREFLMIKHTLLSMTTGGVSEAFEQGQHRHLHRTILALLLQVMQQWTGINVFMQYLGLMFRHQLQYAPKLALLLAACCATEFFLATFVAVVGLDRFWGRRSLTMFGASGMCGCMIVLSVMAWWNTQIGLYVMTGFLFLFVTFFAIGWQGMSWLWAVELIPLSIRGPVNAMSTASHWLANFVVVFVTPILFVSTTWRTYVIFAVTNFCIVPTIWLLYPETGGRSLEEVDVVFNHATKNGRNAWFSVVRTAAQEPLWSERTSDPADDSEKGRSNSDSEKSKRPLMQDSDASLWTKYRRQPHTSSGSEITNTRTSQTTDSDGIHRVSMNSEQSPDALYGVNKTVALPRPSQDAASPPPAIDRR